MKSTMMIVPLLLTVASGVGHAASLIFNEYNAVGATKRPTAVGSGDPRDDEYFASLPCLPNGRVEGNGGNWWELVVTKDHLDLRGWELRWANYPDPSANRADGETDPWFGNASVEQGIVTFSNDPTWADLRAGTIITLSTQSSIAVDIDCMEGNCTDGIDPANADCEISLSSETSYDPAGGDWNIHVSSFEEVDDPSPLVSTIHNRTDQGPGFFAAGSRDLQLSIFDESGARDFGPIGESIPDFGSCADMSGNGRLDGEQVAKLEFDPSANAENCQFQDGGTGTFSLPNRWSNDGLQDFEALRAPEPSPAVLAVAALLAIVLLRSARTTV